MLVKEHVRKYLLHVLSIKKALSFEWKPIELEGNHVITRAYHTAHVIGGYMYVFGGLDETGKTTNQFWKLCIGNPFSSFRYFNQY